MKGSGTRPSWSGLMRFLQLGETSYVKIPWWNSRCCTNILLSISRVLWDWGEGVIMIIVVKLFTYSFISKLNYGMCSLGRDFEHYENVYWAPTMWGYFAGVQFYNFWEYRRLFNVIFMVQCLQKKVKLSNFIVPHNLWIFAPLLFLNTL